MHREQKVRSHILRFVRYDGQSIWRAGRREASEITGESTEKGRDSASGGKCTCDPLREIVEGEMLPCLSNVMSQGEWRRWLLIVRKTSYICGCGGIYDHLWREALIFVCKGQLCENTCAMYIRGCPIGNRGCKATKPQDGWLRGGGTCRY